MDKFYSIVLLSAILIFCSGFKLREHFDEFYTEQPCVVDYLDKTTPQAQYAMTLKFVHDVNLNKIKVGANVLLILPSDLKTESGFVIPAGTKFNARLIHKSETHNPFKQTTKFLINQIIFATDAKEYILLSDTKHAKRLTTISSERVLGRYAPIDGLCHIGTKLYKADYKGNLKSKADTTTTSVGICFVLIRNSILNRTIKANTPIKLEFEKNLNLTYTPVSQLRK